MWRCHLSGPKVESELVWSRLSLYTAPCCVFPEIRLGIQRCCCCTVTKAAVTAFSPDTGNLFEYSFDRLSYITQRTPSSTFGHIHLCQGLLSVPIQYLCQPESNTLQWWPTCINFDAFWLISQCNYPSNVIVLVPKNVDSGSPSNILRIC